MMDERKYFIKTKYIKDCASPKICSPSSTKMDPNKVAYNLLNLSNARRANKSRTFLLLLLSSECNYLKKTQLSKVNSITFAEAEKVFSMADVYIHLKPELHSPNCELSGKGEGYLNKKMQKNSSKSPDIDNSTRTSIIKIDENFGKKETVGRKKMMHFAEKVLNLNPIDGEDFNKQHHLVSNNILNSMKYLHTKQNLLSDKDIQNKAELGFNYLRHLCKKLKLEKRTKGYSKPIEQCIFTNSAEIPLGHIDKEIPTRNSERRMKTFPLVFVSIPIERTSSMVDTDDRINLLEKKKKSLEVKKKRGQDNTFHKSQAGRASSVISISQCPRQKDLFEGFPGKKEYSSESDQN